MSKSGKRLLEAAREMREIARGEAVPAHIHVPPDVDVRAIRRSLGMSQDAFATEFAFSINQIRDWEQNRTRPLDSNRAYLMLIERHPDTVRQMLAEVRVFATSDDEKVRLAM
ncbi:transcriptional regulator [Corticibacterium sp. UT-5YL-CI-8]|nr:transcriptional regulator [Tianweitania sp. UT-5YL-CI-8]